MSNTPRYPGTMRAKVEYAEDGTPLLTIDIEEMERIQALLLKQNGKEPTMAELVAYVEEAQKQ